MNGSNIYKGGTSVTSTDGTLAFGYMAALALNADCNIIGRGGMGLYPKDSGTEGMNEIWNLTSSAKAPGAQEYDLSRTRYPYMEEIYQYIEEKCGIDKALALEMMHYEVEVERQVIVPRQSVVDIFNYCKEIGKKVYIVSDMYMHKEELESIINGIGISGYDKILVSCEYDTSKPQRLFECYKQEVSADSYLHIGDSFACDIAPSAKLGIDSFRLKMSSEIWEETGNKPSKDLETRTEQAKYIAKELNSPFSIAK